LAASAVRCDAGTPEKSHRALHVATGCATLSLAGRRLETTHPPESEVPFALGVIPACSIRLSSRRNAEVVLGTVQ